jgi:hypothetical protein
VNATVGRTICSRCRIGNSYWPPRSVCPSCGGEWIEYPEPSMLNTTVAPCGDPWCKNCDGAAVIATREFLANAISRDEARERIAAAQKGSEK